MKRRIRKKKLTLKIYHINQAIIKNAYLRDKYKDDSSINGLVAKFAFLVADANLKFKQRLLTSKLKRGDY
ncbi:hypothetical protein [Lactobacillus crispatus]|uniref:hypothetical protein n=1 Tax=Lactobacillus crispatus TaxID=47770 RepID=UPI0021A73D6E|nr:hypothetical protein [Lactobacillus crispatus]MCT3539971.1 hypothetical protein [Lactobacillus crispatus]